VRPVAADQREVDVASLRGTIQLKSQAETRITGQVRGVVEVNRQRATSTPQCDLLYAYIAIVCIFTPIARDPIRFVLVSAFKRAARPSSPFCGNRFGDLAEAKITSLAAPCCTVTVK